MKHRPSPQSVKEPLFRYITFVGGVLLSLLFVASAYLSDSPVDDGSKVVARPTILIESSRRWPERIVFDTNVPTTVAAVPAEEPTIASSVHASPLDSMAQLAAPPPLKQPAPLVAKKKRVKIARQVSQPRFAYFQQPRNSFGSWW